MGTSSRFNIYFINRYGSSIEKDIKNHSGYEQLVKYYDGFKTLESNKFLNKFLFNFLKTPKPKDYRSRLGSIEILLFFKAFITSKPVFYLYADKDAYLLPLLKRKFNLKRIKLFGTLHWPEEISQEFSFYKYNLASEFNGIITLSSSLQPDTTNRCTIPHGINTTFWKNEQPTHYKNQYLILGISNRNHAGQIEVIKRIMQMDPAAQFILLLQDKNVYEAYEGIPNIEIIDTRISDEELKNLYSQSKAVILVQHHCLASNVVLECISMGIPLITNRVGDIEEYLGKEYPLFLDNSVKEERLNNICHSSNFRSEIVEYMTQIKNKFEWKAIAAQTIKFINQKNRSH